MSGDTDAWSRVFDQSLVLAQRAGAALGHVRDGWRGTDSTGSVTVTLDDDARVGAVRLAAGWRQDPASADLGHAVREAVQAAAVARLTAWGEAFTDEPSSTVADVEELFDHRDFAGQLAEASTRQLAADDGRVALTELLAILQDIDHGLDEVLARLQVVQAASYTGHSTGHDVTVTVTGGGDVAEVSYRGRWLAAADEATIERETLTAFAGAYAAAGRDSVDSVIAGSRLGAAQRATQDPFGLARRLRLG